MRGVVVALALAVSAALTVQQIGVWRSTDSLWSHQLRYDPSSPLAHNNLGVKAQTEGRWDEAADRFRRVLSLSREDPHWTPWLEQLAHRNLGVVLVELKQSEAAMRHFQAAQR